VIVVAYHGASLAMFHGVDLSRRRFLSSIIRKRRSC
jgi:hypothetical protein